MTYQVLARKWRPQAFEAVVGQDAITRTIQNALASGRVAHAYLFTGPRGVGKTTTARLLARALCCLTRNGTEACGECPSCLDLAAGASVDVMEIDAASNTSVDDIRTLRENVKYAPTRGRFKVYIVDEVHMLSGAAFNAFLKTLEEPPPHVVFVLATTEPRRIPATVLSRCQRFDFRPIPPELLTASLAEILQKEGVAFEPAALPMLVRASEGSLRDALSLLDTAVAYGNGRLDEASVAQLLGASTPAHVRAFVTALVGRDGAAALEAIDAAAQAGEDILLLCREVIETARRMLILKVGPAKALPDLTPAEAETLQTAGAPASVDELIYLLRAFIDADTEMRRSPHPRVELEIAAVRATQRPAPQAVDTLLARVEEAMGRLRAMPAAAPGAPSGRGAAAQESLLGSPRAAAPVSGGSAPAPPSPAAPPVPRREAPAASRMPTPTEDSSVPREPARSDAPPAPRPPTRTEAPPAPRAAAPSDDDPPPPPSGELGVAWERVVNEVMSKKALLGSVLQHATPLGVTGDVLTIALAGNHFHREMLGERVSRDLVSQALRRHLPGVTRFELDATGGGGGGAREHPAVQTALNVFPGEVVAVRQRAPEEGESS